jgi:adenylyltransferase/sulfurtransferase
MASINVIIPSALNKGEGERKININANTLSEALNILVEQLGNDFKRKVFDTSNKPRSLINIYINGKNIRFTGGLETKLNDNDEIVILPAVAGGSEFTREELERYSRQIMLDGIGYEGQLKLRDAKVCIVGVGGLGSPIAMQLTAMGIGHLRIIDRDVVEISNLHRQTLYNEQDIGKVKVEVAYEKLKAINPKVEIDPLPVSINENTALEVVKGYDIVIDGLDSVLARYALNDACLYYNIPYIYGGAIGMLGSACTILPYKSACLRCIFPSLVEEEMPTCSTEGVHPSILSIISAIEVSEAVKIIIGKKPSLVNKLLYVDLNDLTFDIINIERNLECKSCSNLIQVSNLNDNLLIEELCGRDMGKRTYSITPVKLKSLDIADISNKAMVNGYNIQNQGSMGITILNKKEKVSISLLKSGAAVIVGAKDEEHALSIYKSLINS